MPITLILTATLLLSGDSPQRRAPGAPNQGGVTATIALRAGTQAYDFSGTAQCRHAPQASIYGIAAEMWSVQHADSGRSMNLTVWKPRSGGDPMLNLSVTTAGRSSNVNTVKAPQRATGASGSGSVTFAPEGKGGLFTIAATTDDGAKVSGTVKCDAFTPLVAEGGN